MSFWFGAVSDVHGIRSLNCAQISCALPYVAISSGSNAASNAAVVTSPPASTDSMSSAWNSLDLVRAACFARPVTDVVTRCRMSGRWANQRIRVSGGQSVHRTSGDHHVGSAARRSVMSSAMNWTCGLFAAQARASRREASSVRSASSCTRGLSGSIVFLQGVMVWSSRRGSRARTGGGVPCPVSGVPC